MDYDKSKLRRYFFPTENIPRLSFKDPLHLHLISEGKPVVITDSGLCKTALKWNLPYLKENLGVSKYTVYSSPSHIFKYFDDQKITKYAPNFEPSIEKLEITFTEFVDKLSEWKPGGKRLYLQQPLNNTVGHSVAKDFADFSWNWLIGQQKRNDWGPLTSNLLLVGMEGNLTPVHYDEQQNFFCQLIGIKRCILFQPDHYENLYAHPVYHPHDRQSQVDLENPDFETFPNLKKLEGFEAIVYPGDILYIPLYWWHHIESLETISFSNTANEASPNPLENIRSNVSVNFWYKAGPTKSIEYPLAAHHKLAITRNIEKMLLEALKNAEEVGPLLRAIVDGRYSLGMEEKTIFENS